MRTFRVVVRAIKNTSTGTYKTKPVHYNHGLHQMYKYHNYERREKEGGGE